MLRINFGIFIKSLVQTRSISSLTASLNRDIVKSPTDSNQLQNELSREPDVLTQRIKTADDSYELLDLMSVTSRQDVDQNHLTQAFSRLHTLQRTGSAMHSSKLTRHTGFSNMCNLLKFKAQRMEANDLVICLKVVIHFGVRSDSITIQRLLHLIKDQINDLTLNHLIFLSFLLTKLDKTPLSEAIKIAIPVVFDLNVNLKLDHNNTTELTELLHFMSTSSMRISNKSMMNIITALTLHGTSYELNEAKSIVWSLTQLRRFEPTMEKLFDNAMTILNDAIMDLNFVDMETTLWKLIDRFVRGDRIFYHEDYFRNCARYVIENDTGYLCASYILKKFNKVSYVSYDLLDYIDRTVVENHSTLSSCMPSGLLTFSGGFSNANYKSENWEILKSILHENPMMHSDKMDLPWLKFVLELMSVGFQSNILFGKVFSTRFLEQYLSREENKLDYSQLLTLWQGVNLLIPEYSGPLPEKGFIDDAIALNFTRTNEFFLNILSDIFGGREFVQTNVATSYGHCLDFVLSFDKYENPIAMPCKIKMYDDLPKSQVKSVVVFFHSRSSFPLNYPGKLRGMNDFRQRTIEALGIRTVNISTPLWNSLPESEKSLFLEREIRYGLK